VWPKTTKYDEINNTSHWLYTQRPPPPSPSSSAETGFKPIHLKWSFIINRHIYWYLHCSILMNTLDGATGLQIIFVSDILLRCLYFLLIYYYYYQVVRKLYLPTYLYTSPSYIIVWYNMYISCRVTDLWCFFYMMFHRILNVTACIGHVYISVTGSM